MRVLLSPLTRAPLPTRVFFFFFFFFLPSFPPPLPFAIRQSALFFSLILCYKFQFSRVCRPKRGANGKGASERKQNAGLLSLSLSRCVRVPRGAFLRSRAKSFFRRVKACVVFECFTFFPSRVFSTVFFSLINLGFLSLFQAFWIRFQKRHSFGLLLPNTPLQRERERERGRHEDSLENAVRRALDVFRGALFLRRFRPPFGSRLFEMDFFCLLSSFDSFFPIEIPESKTTLTRNACASLLLPRVGYKTTERRKSSTST